MKKSRGARPPQGAKKQSFDKRARPHGGPRPSGSRSGGAPASPRPPRDNARWVVGLHASAEALKVRPRGIREVWVREDFKSSQSLREIAEAAESARIPVKPKAPGQLDAVASGHQGVALAMTETLEVDWDQLKAPGSRLVVLLDGIEDPQNLGSMLRTAWLTNVSAIFIPEDRAVSLTPTVCKIASGGAEHVPVESHPNLGSVIEDLKEAGFWIYGLAESGKQRPWDLKLPEKVAWVIGSESSGMRVSTERACDEVVRIPQVKTGSSYNASIALAMVLIETCRQSGSPE